MALREFGCIWAVQWVSPSHEGGRSRLVPMISYLDAGTGSMLVSILGGGLAGIGVFWKMIRAKVTGKPMPTDDSESDSESGSAHD